MGAGDSIQPFLLGAPILRSAGDAQAQCVAIEAQARRGIGHHDRGVVDPEEEAVAPAPLRITFARRELQHLERMPVGVAEVEGADATGGRVPVRQPLRTFRDSLHSSGPKHRVRPVHVRHDDGHVLEPPVVAPRVVRRGAPLRLQVLGQIDALAAQAQPRGAAAGMRHALETIQRLSRLIDPQGLLERKHAGIERHRTVEIGDGHPDAAHRPDQSGAVRAGSGAVRDDRARRDDRCPPQSGHGAPSTGKCRGPSIRYGPGLRVTFGAFAAHRQDASRRGSLVHFRRENLGRTDGRSASSRLRRRAAG